MKLCRGWVMSAGLLLAATSANAQTVITADGHGPRYSAVSDFDGPYAAMPPGAPGYGPRLLPAPEVYTVLRDNGFSPLGAPRQRGFFYSIAVLDRDGGEGRLVIDARDGRIVRYMQGYQEDAAYGPPREPPPVISAVRGPPRPPASVPHLASRTPGVPLPKAMPPRPDAAPQTVGKASEPSKDVAKAEPAKPSEPKSSEPAPQSLAQAKPAVVPAAPPAVIDAKPEIKPAPQIQPTKDMPKVQDLE